MSWASFNILCDLLRLHVPKQVIQFKTSTEVDLGLTITLNRLAIGNFNAHIANLYSISSVMWEYILSNTKVWGSKIVGFF